MPNERILEMNDRIRRIEANAIMSPADEAIFDLCKSIINELQMIDGAVAILEAGEGPIGCADDGDDLSIALRRLGREGVNRVLKETLGPPNPLYVDELGNG